MGRNDIVELADGAWVLTGPVNLGLVRGPEGLLAVDAGLDEESAGRLLEAAAALGGPLTRVFVTHGHADHCGGCRALARRAGVQVLAPEGEAPFVENTWLDPAVLAGGTPFRELRGKFLQARPCRVDRRVGPGPLPGAVEAEVVPLPGHSADMCGLRAGKVLFAADAFFPPELIVKHGLLYNLHPHRFLESLAVLEKGGGTVVPAHGPAVGLDLAGALAANRRHLAEVEAATLELLSEPTGREELAAALARRFGAPSGHASWALALGATQGYLTALREEDLVYSHPVGGRLLWRRL